MTIKSSLTVLALAGLTLAPIHGASADVTVTLHTTYQGPLVDSLKQQGRGDVFNQLSEMRMSIAVSRSRIDLGPVDVITDLTAKQITTLNPTAHTYTQKAYDPADAKNAMASILGGTKTVYSNVIDSGETSQLLGHTVHHYTAKITTTLAIPNLPADKQINEGNVDLLIADDLPKADMDACAAFGASMGIPIQLKGVALMSRSTFTSGFLTGMVTNSVATAISTKPIADAVFAIPNGYTKAEAPTAAKPVQ